ncbi:MAG: DUF3365 domain-containing protein [Lysobacterales bacterium]|jgi:hypothetical protein
MNRTPITACLLAAAFACHAEAPAGTSDDADINAARAAIEALAATLKAELTGAMQSGGPGKAIEVCNTQAMPLTRKIADEQGYEIGRVSLKNRNPANAASPWQAEVLEDFEVQRALGIEINAIAWTETVETGEGKEFRYMKPIPTAGVCLTCHGVQLPPVVQQVLAEKYPDDRATGYAEGDIRGAFVVTRKLAN